MNSSKSPQGVVVPWPGQQTSNVMFSHVETPEFPLSEAARTNAEYMHRHAIERKWKATSNMQVTA